MADSQSDAVKTPIAPGLIARISRAVQVISGSTEAWFGPAQPLAPLADAPADDTRGRQFDYRFGWNQQTVKRQGEAVTFDQMRALADSYDLLRVVLETRKDQLSKLNWKIVPRAEDVEAGDTAMKLQEFFAFPDKEHDFSTWIRMLVEEMYVTDAACVYPRMNRGGGVYSFDLMDGSTINRMLDGTGRTPIAPDPAYQQILHGIPAVNYTADELIYRPRNVRVWKPYGFSVVEQIITTVNIALRRQINQLSFYTNGNTPSLLFNVPETWSPDQIKQMQGWWDELTAHGRDYGARFIPGGVKPYDTKEAVLKDEFDEWLARIVCFAFSIEPTPFVKQTNRATAETSRQQSMEEGIVPVQVWLKSIIDQCLRVMGVTDHEFIWDEEESIDPLVQAQIAQIYVGAKIITADEARNTIGMDPLSPAQKDEMAPAPVVPMGTDGKPVPANDDAEPVGKALLVKKKPLTLRKGWRGY